MSAIVMTSPENKPDGEATGFDRLVSGLNSRVPLSLVVTLSVARFVYNIARYAIGNDRSDTLLTFPAASIARWAGRYDDLFVGSLAHGFYGQFPQEPFDLERHWAYGPIFHVLSAPMLLFPDIESGYSAFLVISLAVFFLAVATLVRTTEMPFRLDMTTAFLAVVVLNNYAVYNALTLRAIELYELLFLVLGAYAFSLGRHRTSGILIGLGALTKFIPGVVIPYFLIRRQWRAALYAAGTVAVGMAAAEYLLGLEYNPMFSGLLLGGDSIYLNECMTEDVCAYSPHPHNQALSGVVFRLGSALGYGTVSVGLIQVGMLAGVLALGLWLLTRDGAGTWLIEWSVVLIAAILLVPKNEYYYFCLLVFPFVVALRECTRSDSRLPRGLLGVAYILVGVPVPVALLFRLIPGSTFATPADIANRFLEWNLPFLGAVALLAALVLQAGEAQKVRHDHSLK